MKKTVYGALLAVVTAVLLLGCDNKSVVTEDQALSDSAGTREGDREGDKEDNKIALNDNTAKASYLLGYGQSEQIMQQSAKLLHPDAFLAGAGAALSGQTSQLEAEDAQLILQAFQAAIQARRNEASAGVVADGDAFRAEFAKRPQVVSLPSGLLYEVLVAGDGPKPTLTDTVTTHYHGSLVDGSVFDSSVERGQPASFPVNGVIAGWTEALQLMSVGAKWKLVIPPDLAYGERGAGGSIPPQATLMFEVELLSID